MGQEAIFLRGECLLQRASRESDLHAGRARPVGCAHGGAGPPAPGPHARPSGLRPGPPAVALWRRLWALSRGRRAFLSVCP